MSTGNIKKKKMFLGSKVRLVRGADNLTAIYETIVYKMWESPLHSTLRASMACYGDSFIFTFLLFFFFLLLILCPVLYPACHDIVHFLSFCRNHTPLPNSTARSTSATTAVLVALASQHGTRGPERSACESIVLLPG
jgi:hypothetical protein